MGFDKYIVFIRKDINNLFGAKQDGFTSVLGRDDLEGTGNRTEWFC
jgi:hypothetical protein